VGARHVAVAALEDRRAVLEQPAKDPGYVSPYLNWFRFSFGPLLPESFDADVPLFGKVLDGYRADVTAGRAPDAPTSPEVRAGA
jgi:hypothetical protein